MRADQLVEIGQRAGAEVERRGGAWRQREFARHHRYSARIGCNHSGSAADEREIFPDLLPASARRITRGGRRAGSGTTGSIPAIGIAAGALERHAVMLA